ncbi:hypothetical protein [uncultured Dokdonia sp.]|uniref:hypothetical protein n=1 Tax=uncultured Dokdonia sp. TaxID=575653 RepID=UPI00261D3C1C|nr:hypothetical protein [uncultured Dokdonia sp.]
MGYKKKWIDRAEDDSLKYLDKISDIISPLFKNNGKADLLNLDKREDLEDFLALLFNCNLSSHSQSFGADYIIALQIEVENNKLLHYWGKINWLGVPSGHECHNSFQDPFYALFKFENNHIELVKAMFGDYDKNDLDSRSWIYSEIDWMYDL